ncbi:hypothetical protein [Lentzea flaviverrucosa]|uniref:hypothetical protein n=1 Tax=Lentzea flaviverrucosa TaxID=200379 RepID=UPI001B872909|nr:hypothetical protein [Lentzea flaviverrucosa]
MIRPQPRPGDGVDRVVDAGVAGLEAPEHGVVGGVDDRVGRQPGDVTAPHRDRRGQLQRVGGPRALPFAAEQGIQHGDELGVERRGPADGQQCPQQAPPFAAVLRHLEPADPRVVIEHPQGEGRQQVEFAGGRGRTERAEGLVQCDRVPVAGEGGEHVRTVRWRAAARRGSA